MQLEPVVSLATLTNVCVTQRVCMAAPLSPSLFAQIKEEGLCKASSTSSGLQIAVFTQSVCECASVCPCVFSSTLKVKSPPDL